MKTTIYSCIALAMLVACGPVNTHDSQDDSSDGLLPGAGPAGAVTNAIMADEEPEEKVEKKEEKELEIGGNPMQVYLDDPEIIQVAKDYYTGRFEISDEPKTHSMVKALNTCGEAHRPFYLSVFNKMVKDAEKDVADALGAPAREFIEKDPVVFSQFAANSKAEYAGNKNKWVELVGFEFVLEDDPKAAFASYKTRLEKVCETCSDKQKAALSDFIGQLEAYVQENG